MLMLFREIIVAYFKNRKKNINTLVEQDVEINNIKTEGFTKAPLSFKRSGKCARKVVKFLDVTGDLFPFSFC
jgi:hypothetical protein